MSSSVNMAIIIGNVGQDPKVLITESGTTIANLSVATSHSIKKGDEWQEVTEWHRVVAFGKTADSIGRFVKKGSKLFIEGRLQTRKYDKDGSTHYSTEVVANVVKFLTPRDATTATSPIASGFEAMPEARATSSGGTSAEYLDDGLF